MAAFNNPSDAVHAAFDAQHGLGAFNDSSGKDEIVIKLGLHTGPCIVVTLNEQLDYFGSTINMAARLQGESEGGEIVISDILAHDPGVAAILTAFKATPESRTFKGFDKPIEFVRLTPAALAANAVK